ELRTRTFRFTYQTTVKEIPAGAKSLDVWLPYPQSDRNQTIQSVKIDAPGKGEIRKMLQYGNKDYHFHQENPSGPVQITMEVTATRRENAGEKTTLPPSQAEAYLQP